MVIFPWTSVITGNEGILQGRPSRNTSSFPIHWEISIPENPSQPSQPVANYQPPGREEGSTSSHSSTLNKRIWIFRRHQPRLLGSSRSASGSRSMWIPSPSGFGTPSLQRRRRSTSPPRRPGAPGASLLAHTRLFFLFLELLKGSGLLCSP